MVTEQDRSQKVSGDRKARFELIVYTLSSVLRQSKNRCVMTRCTKVTRNIITSKTAGRTIGDSMAGSAADTTSWTSKILMAYKD